ncbi:MAG: ankyrin repeat domain-containing protein, partial [Gammaproteobacteria bacterium]|nr:ankyrin repeat domain-containing protein [Gammaproteobacteria bacterium]
LHYPAAIQAMPTARTRNCPKLTPCALTVLDPPHFESPRRASSKRRGLYAAGQGHAEVVAILLKYSANPEARARRKYVPLHACAYSGDTESAVLLITAGASVDRKDKRGNTPLHWAASADEYEMVVLLVGKGANLNAISKDHATPLEWALRNKNERMARFLIASGASLDVDTASIRLRMAPAEVKRLAGLQSNNLGE